MFIARTLVIWKLHCDSKKCHYFVFLCIIVLLIIYCSPSL